MTIGVCAPVDIKMLDWELAGSDLPETHAVPLSTYFVNGLLARGFKVIVYTNSPELTEPKVYQTEQLTVCVGRMKPQPGRRFFWFEINDMARLIKQHPADFISAFWSYEYAWAAQKSGIPMVVSLHDVALQILLNHKDMFRLVRWAMNYVVVTRATHLIANSDYTYNMLDRSTRRKSRVINNFFSPDVEQMINPNIEKGDYIVSVLMGFSHRKNAETALKAFAQVRQKHPELEYHLVGAEMEENGLAHRYALQNGLAEGVRFLGQLPFKEVMDQIAGAKALLHPAREESFGMVLLEAMVARTAVIGGEKSGYVPTLLDKGNTGLLCDVESPESIAAAVLQLVEDDKLRARLEEKGYAFAQENYSADAIIQQHLDYYATILGKPLVPTMAGSGTKATAAWSN
ncbi:glycosyltransferase involved in cell wall biosynthesis [Pontibacter mucosus]|uniref:Glycosyltransferase involved in cell wall biosynthesis n=1 Tax=Pontibacter mucosus TaxID=1649266 RepID=A0A2T5YPZ1_9BACT|nr:glycosyltransferase family 4 protein [Pontibacter mucosus]PTX21380.1 glycosyltransferase involved in cell wall biosynthesis [Pontibacter mucosus]